MGKLAHTHTARIVGCRSVEPRSLSSLISLSWASHRQSTSVEIVLLSVSSFEPVKKCWLDPECTMVGWPQDAVSVSTPVHMCITLSGVVMASTARPSLVCVTCVSSSSHLHAIGEIVLQTCVHVQSRL